MTRKGLYNERLSRHFKYTNINTFKGQIKKALNYQSLDGADDVRIIGIGIVQNHAIGRADQPASHPIGQGGSLVSQSAITLICGTRKKCFASGPQLGDLASPAALPQ